MKNLAVILLFVLSLFSLGMAFKLQSDVQPPSFTVDPVVKSPIASADAGSRRGKPGEDDEDEEDEEDLRAP